MPAAVAPLHSGVPELRHLPGLHDPVSAVTHLFGAAGFLALGALLLRRGRGDPARLAFLAVYAAAGVLLFAASGGYHMTAAGGPARAVLQRLDHAAIFVLIAGTFTPVHGLLFRGPLRWGPLLLVWAAAAAGVVLKAAYFDAVAEWVGLTLYLSVGWLGLLSGLLLGRRHGFAFVRPLALGGAAYSVGAALDFLRWPVLVPGAIQSHEVFHLAVLAGAGWHFAFVWGFADGRLPPRRPADGAAGGQPAAPVNGPPPGPPRSRPPGTLAAPRPAPPARSPAGRPATPARPGTGPTCSASPRR